MTTVFVALGPRSYDISISSGCEDHFPGFLAARVPSIRSFFVADSNTLPVAEHLAARVPGSIVTEIPAGEPSKSLEVAARLYCRLAELPADRRTPVVACGGGVIGDLAGFVAATYNRGLPLIMVPTSLLAMVDSSVGGKVGINIPHGKNLVGAFHQPAGVWIDTAYLARLPDREYRSGLAEVVKYGLALDAEFYRWIERHVDALLLRKPETLVHTITRCCELKAGIVQRDEREESGERMVLNLGHTFGHAYESAAGYGAWLHGEAVAAGLVSATLLAERRGLIAPDVRSGLTSLLHKLGLPIHRDPSWDPEDLLAAMRRDKKNAGGAIRFILPTRLGGVALFDDVPISQVREVLAVE